MEEYKSIYFNWLWRSGTLSPAYYSDTEPDMLAICDAYPQITWMESYKRLIIDPPLWRGTTLLGGLIK